ncbi:MAG: hypothetical protein EOM05_09955 [Clostridia bacterium]|nr:hypothetical protein [Clostridia bacterium]
MADFNLNEQQMKKIKENFGKENVKKAKELERAIKSGESNDFLNKNLNPKQSALLQKVLSDKDAAEKLLATEQAQKLLKKMLGDK